MTRNVIHTLWRELSVLLRRFARALQGNKRIFWSNQSGLGRNAQEPRKGSQEQTEPRDRSKRNQPRKHPLYPLAVVQSCHAESAAMHPTQRTG